MKLQDLIDYIKKYDHGDEKKCVIYSNENKLMSYDFLGVYENEGQVEIYISEGESLEIWRNTQ